MSDEADPRGRLLHPPDDRADLRDATRRRSTLPSSAWDRHLPAPAWVRVLDFATAADAVAVRRLTRAGRERASRHLAGRILTTRRGGAVLWAADRHGARLRTFGNANGSGGGALAAAATACAFSSNAAASSETTTTTPHAPSPAEATTPRRSSSVPRRAAAQRDDEQRATNPVAVGSSSSLPGGARGQQQLNTRQGRSEALRVPIRVAVSSDDGVARLWDASTNTALAALRGQSPKPHDDEILSVAFSPDGTRLATASADTTARLWNVNTGALQLTLRSHANAVTSCVFSPDGAAVATTSWDKTARVWDAVTGAAKLTIEAHSAWVSRAAYSPTGDRIATCGWDALAKLWDAATGRRRCTLKGHADVLHFVVFSPNGTRVVTCSSDATARIWDCSKPAGKSAPLLCTLRGHTLRVNSAAFARNDPGGKRLVTASHDGTARVWDAHSGRLLDVIDFYSASDVGVSGDEPAVGAAALPASASDDPRSPQQQHQGGRGAQKRRSSHVSRAAVPPGVPEGILGCDFFHGAFHGGGGGALVY